jgi:hypothetical protein
MSTPAQHLRLGARDESGVDTGHADYASFADFRDPDGNACVLQERGHSPI